MNKKLKGFTLAEVTITLVLLSVIVAVMIPAATNISPSNTKVGLKTANNIISTVTEKLINNEIFYPSDEIDNTDSLPLGFLYTNTGSDYTSTSDEATYIAARRELKNAYSAITTQCPCYDKDITQPKLVVLFCCSMNVSKDNVSCDTTKCSFSTNNGMQWIVTNNIGASGASVSTKNTQPVMTIEVDVNGSTNPNSKTSNAPDKFNFNVYYNGVIKFDSATASSAKGEAYLKDAFSNRKKD